MLSYIIRRMLSIFLVAIVASIIIFVLVQLPPGDYIDYYISRVGATGEAVNIDQISEQLRSYYGLDLPVYTRYFRWLSDVIKGDFGYSLQHNAPVRDIIMRELGWTILISVLTLAFSWIIGVLLGIYSAVKRYSFWDHLMTFFGFLGMSTPPFFV